MFSWIIKAKAKILEMKSWVFKVKNVFNEKLEIWESISHDWACMTITQVDEEYYSFFVMEESIKKTNFFWKKIWEYFNVESSIRLWDKLDWHMVSWHIDWIGEVIWVEIKKDLSKIIKIKQNKKFNNLIIEKWSITISWVSLTVVEDNKEFFSLSLIPLTQEITNLWELKIWDIVNLEFDMIGKYISKIMKK